MIVFLGPAIKDLLINAQQIGNKNNCTCERHELVKYNDYVFKVIIKCFVNQYLQSACAALVVNYHFLYK